MKRVFIADIKSWPKWTGYGHYLSVAQNYIDILNGRAEVVVAGCQEYEAQFKGPLFCKLPKSNNGNYKLEKMETLINSIVLFWKARGHVIVLQQSTSITSFIAIALFYWFTGKLYLIQYDTSAINTKIKYLIWRLAKWKVNGLICPNNRIADAYGINACIVTDYIHCKDDIPVIPFNERKWDIGFVGTITNNKGSVQAIEELAPYGYKIVVAGKIGNGETHLEPRLNNLIAKYSNIEHHVGFISEVDYVHYIQYSKFCMLNYIGEYQDRSSGVVLDIIFNGTPVLGTHCDALKMIDEDNMGIIYNKVEEITVNTFTDVKSYEAYLRSISNYINKQKNYRDKLSKFILQ